MLIAAKHLGSKASRFEENEILRLRRQNDTNGAQRYGAPRLGLLAIVVMTLVVAAGFGAASGPGAAIGMMQTREQGNPAAGTPVAATAEPDDPLDGDPLDGDPGAADPLDGEPPGEDEGAPADQTHLEIVRSGRPSQESRTLESYDDDPATAWVPEAANGETWVWFDLGTEQRVREVRWLALGDGAVDVSISSDRRRWQEIERVEVDGEWQGVTLREDAQYVRLSLVPNDDAAPPAIAEVAVYGKDRGDSVAAEQEAENDRERRRDRRNRDDTETGSRRNGAAADDAAAETSDDNGRRQRRGGRVRIAAEPGETRCTGDRERCQARQGTVSMEEDCEADGSCTIDIQVDGGTAACDATGGDEARAGDGQGRRSGDGGECEAVANGGAVAIGDINP